MMSSTQRDITKKIGSPKQPSNPFLEMVKFLLERIAPVHIDTESIRLVGEVKTPDYVVESIVESYKHNVVLVIYIIDLILFPL